MKSIIIKTSVVGLVATVITFSLWGQMAALGTVAGTLIIVGDTISIGFIARKIVARAENVKQNSLTETRKVSFPIWKILFYGFLMLVKFAIIFILVGLAVHFIDAAGVAVGISSLLGGVVWYGASHALARQKTTST